MTDLSRPDVEQPGELLSPFLARAREQLNTEPSRAMVARIPKDPADDTWTGAVLKPAVAPFTPSLVGQSPFESKSFATMLIAAGTSICGSLGGRFAYDLGVISEPQFLIAICVLAGLVVVLGIGGCIASAFDDDLRTRAAWVLSPPTARRPALPSKDRDVLSGGEEERLARHSAAALWGLHAGVASAAWRSDSLTSWRAAVDLRAEVAATIRSAGELQELRETLGEFPADLDSQTQSAWKGDYAVYKSGLAALRERVEQQLALQMAVEAIGRQLKTPVDERHELADRIAASIPSHEQAVENISALNSESQELLGFLSAQIPVLEQPKSRSSVTGPGCHDLQDDASGNHGKPSTTAEGT